MKAKLKNRLVGWFCFIIGLASAQVFPLAVVPTPQDRIINRFSDIETFFIVYYECSAKLPPFQTFRGPSGTSISWVSKQVGDQNIVTLNASSPHDKSIRTHQFPLAARN